MAKGSRFVYILGPHIEGDGIIALRIAIQHAEVLRNAGFTPYVPQLTTLWRMIAPREMDDFNDIHMDFMQKCDAVVKIPGMSHAGTDEEQLAMDLGIPVYETAFDLINDKPKIPALTLVANTGT